MIVIIDKKTDESYHSKFMYKAADFIGVHRITISRWIKGGKKAEKYNRYTIYLSSNEL